jgi:plasmid stabilization system protein ParE
VIGSRFLPLAEAELLEAVAFYSQAGTGTGVRFQQAVETVVTKVILNPDSAAPGLKGTRRRIVAGFPYNVVYRANDVELLIVAIAHHRRRPGYWANRIR